VCDIDMPGMDGGDVSAALFEDEETRRIPLLFLTALAMPADIKRLNGQMSGRAAMSKSAPIDQLIARIETLITVS
jgi:CheY-like chemotaxis protein